MQHQLPLRGLRVAPQNRATRHAILQAETLHVIEAVHHVCPLVQIRERCQHLGVA